jgi:predicted AAA+ superfamily ATPase
MINIGRYIENQIVSKIVSNKVILLFGTRRVGKTFLINSIQKKYPEKLIVLNGEDLEVQELLKNRTIANYKNLLGNTKLLIIDEAQAIPDIGQSLKLMIDTNSALTIIATGSSSLDLINKSGEPLTGRQLPFYLYPIAQLELKENPFEARQHLDERMIYGSYPEIFSINTNNEKAAYLQQLVQSYLLKDILSYSGIKHADKIFSLLRLIAFQVGSEVSYNELSNQLGISKITVENYLDLLSKVFIIYKLPSYSSNQRSEVTKSAKWYFFDNGIRNAIINDFRMPSMRNDMGALWENYIISERIKKTRYCQELTQFFFWRNYNQQEVDLIELNNGIITGIEIKFTATKKMKKPPAFDKIYPTANFKLISKENYLDFIMP